MWRADRSARGGLRLRFADGASVVADVAIPATRSITLTKVDGLPMRRTRAGNTERERLPAGRRDEGIDRRQRAAERPCARARSRDARDVRRRRDGGRGGDRDSIRGGLRSGACVRPDPDGRASSAAPSCAVARAGQQSGPSPVLIEWWTSSAIRASTSSRRRSRGALRPVPTGSRAGRRAAAHRHRSPTQSDGRRCGQVPEAGEARQADDVRWSLRRSR